MDLEKNLSAHGYTPGEVEAGNYCFDDATVLLGEYIVELKRLRARVAELEGEVERLKDEDRLPIRTALRAQVAALTAERDRLREALGHIAEGSTPWVDGYYRTSWEVIVEYARAALAGKEE